MVSNTIEENESALRQIKTVLKGRIDPSDRLTFRPSVSHVGRNAIRSRTLA
jgi:hypothetical protein